jgi:hypothetical protein
MSDFEAFQNHSGNWQGTNTLHDPQTNQPDATIGTAALRTSENVLQLAYTWSYQSKPQQGTIEVKNIGEQMIASLIDSWHTGGQPMLFKGKPDPEKISLHGTYSAPPGPDWGWRIDLVPAGEELKMFMWNIFPEEMGGQECIAVEAIYTRS